MSGWFQEQRISFVVDMIHVYGFINRDHLVRKFGISIPQAALDFRMVRERWPDLLVYNKSSKRYEAAK